MVMMAGTLISCGDGNKAPKEKVIEKQTVTTEDGCMTPEILWKLGRLSGLKVSPDGTMLLYGVTYYDMELNKGNRDLYAVPVAGGAPERLTRTPFSENEESWSRDGKLIYFLSSESGSSQLWRMNKNGKRRRQLTNYVGGIDTYSFSPDGRHLLFISQVQYGKRVKDLYPDLPLSSGRVIDDLMYKHWDEWVESVPHPFVADISRSGKLTNCKDLLEGLPYESPMKPWGGIEQLAWSPDGKYIAYTCRKKSGMEYAISTNSDIYLYTVATGKTTNLTEGMMGYDQNPVFSPDGRYIAFESMERDGYESDLNRLFIHDLQTGTNRFLSKALDGDVSNLCWSSDGSILYFLSSEDAVIQLYSADFKTGAFKRITNGLFDIESLAVAGEHLVCYRHSMERPNELYRIKPATGTMTALTDENGDIYK